MIFQAQKDDEEEIIAENYDDPHEATYQVPSAVCYCLS
jgi:hypothetical protein